MDFEDDNSLQPNMSAAPAGASDSEDVEAPEDQKKLAQRLIATIKADRKHHDKAFKRMRRDMHVAMWGADKEWGEARYRANISGRHVKQKTAALYAKNPKASARRREQMDYVLWDENPQSLMLAMQIVQMGQQAVQMAQQAPPVVGMDGAPIPQEPQLPPGYQQAMDLIADFQQGYARRQMFDKIGKTTELLFAYFMSQQLPVDFKQGMKSTVRRAITTGVSYVELGFQREEGPRPGLTEQLADARVRLDHLKHLAEDLAEGEMDDDAPERAELELSVAALSAEPNIVLREGLIIDYPMSTKVIPDKNCKSLNGFVGARHLTIEYIYTPEEVEEIFGVDLKQGYTSYTTNAGSSREVASDNIVDDDYEWSSPDRKNCGMVCVWKHYDKPTGLVYYLADGHAGFLREPAPPEVFVETFWPVYALTFNAVESEDELFPPSDVSLMFDMQKEYNRSRQGLREHRQAARPRWVAANGTFGSEEDPMKLNDLQPFQLQMLNMDPQAKIGDILQVLPVPGVDPNLYETSPVFTDTQLVVGSQEAQFGGVSKATATESAIAANSSSSADGSSIDDLDGFLSNVARAAGQILQGNMSEETVKQIVGPGAVWPAQTLAEISSEIHLEVAAGSTGKPNQAVEVANIQRLAPFIMQVPGVNPEWLLKQFLTRLDDRLDISEAIAAGLPSIAAMNQQRQMTAAQPAEDPNAQGPNGANNAPKPGRPGGSDAAFGSNQTDPTPAGASGMSVAA